MINTYFMFKNVDGAIEFFKRCIDRNIDDNDLESKNKILIEMAEEGFMKTVVQTERTKQQIINDFAKHNKVISIMPQNGGKSEMDKGPKDRIIDERDSYCSHPLWEKGHSLNLAFPSSTIEVCALCGKERNVANGGEK